VHTVFRTIRDFFRNKDGQDLAEYCLLLAFVGLLALGIILKASGGIQGIWNATNATLATAPGTPTPGTPSAPASDNGDHR
jgi:Flp pilus assembly pilin Flp